MLILIVAATEPEIAPLVQYLQEQWTAVNTRHFQRDDTEVHLLVTGIGTMATAFSLGVVLGSVAPDLVLNVGIAGAFDRSLPLGAVVHVVTETCADLAIEQADGSLQDLFDTGLLAPNQPPFTHKKLLDPRGPGAQFLPKVHGLTVNKVHGYEPSIAAVQARYPEAQVETMEGAAFFYACLVAEKPFVAVRGISNYVEKRNRAAWKIREAVEAVNQVVIGMLT